MNETPRRLVFEHSTELPVDRLRVQPAAGRRTGCPFHDVREMLREVGLRPTRQRLALGWLLFARGDRHLTAEALHEEAVHARFPVSLATVYNTLHQFTALGMLREVVVEPARSYFDTNTADHHHFFHERTGQLADIPGDQVQLSRLPEAPPGTKVARVDVIVRVRDRGDRR